MTNYFKITFVSPSGVESECMIEAKTIENAVKSLEYVYQGWTVKCHEVI